MTKPFDTDDIARLVKALDCVSGELTPDERRQFEICFTLDNPERRDAVFERLMQDLLCRIRVGNPTLH